jgi:ABC-type multidrug transport system fused ATPase/permease subunit
MDNLLYIGRNTALTILPVLTVASTLRSLFVPVNTAATDAVSCKLPHVFTAMSAFLVVSYLFDPVVFFVQSLGGRDELSNAPAISSVAFICVIVLRLQTISTKEIAFSQKAYVAFWLFLLLVELASSVRVLLRPSLPAPYAQILFSLSILRAVLCFALFVLLVSSHYKGYKRVRCNLEDADVEDDSDEDTDIDSDDGDDTTDEVETKKLIEKEVKELGGWIPYVKSFRVFLRFTWPSDPWMKARFVATFVLVMVDRIIGILLPLQTAKLIDAIDARRDPWTQFAVLLGLRILTSNLGLGLLSSLSWTDVDLARHANLKSEVQSKVMLLDYFHFRSRATDTITAIDNADHVDKLLDTFIFGFFPNIGTLIFAGYSIKTRFGTDIVLIALCMAVAYLCAERKYIAAVLPRYSRFAKLRDSQERRRQDGIRGWITVSAHNMVARENKLYAKEVEDSMDKLRSYRITNIIYSCLDEVIYEVAISLGSALVIFKMLNFKATIGSLTAFFGLWRALMGPINYFKSFVVNLMEQLTDTVRLKKLIEEKPRIQDGDTSLALTKGEICLENVSLAYPGSEKNIVSDINLTIEGGTTVAFVGPSGTGKSTLLKLMVRQLLPTEGRILIDGKDTNTLSKDS